MKTIEEKAKAYDEIIERAKTMLAAGEVMYGKENNASRLITDIIPELAESEDERIRKALVSIVKWLGFDSSFFTATSVTKSEVLAYLKKQEQKPAEWNDTDMKEARDSLISVCRDWEYGKQTTLIPLAAVRARYFLEHLNEPKPAEWSEEDENKIESIKELITMGRFADTNTIRTIWELLDSLRPSWKPSEEQIAELKALANGKAVFTKDFIVKLYNDLLKLK